MNFIPSEIKREIKQSAREFSSELSWIVSFFSEGFNPMFQAKGNESVLWVDGGISRQRKRFPGVCLWMGDGDSGLCHHVCKKVLFPEDKDFLDGEAAFYFLKQVKPACVDFFGFFQGRWDMSLSHFLFLKKAGFLCNRLRIFTDNTVLYYFDQDAFLSSIPGKRFSLIPLETLEVISLGGTKYLMNQKKVIPGCGITLSNQCVSDRIEIRIKGFGKYLVELEL